MTNEKNEMIVVTPNMTAVEIFTEDKIDEILGAIKNECSSFEPDLSSAKSRKEISSLAYKVSRSKTFLDERGKELTADIKKKAKVIDNMRSKVKKELDGLRDEIKKPLTEWTLNEQRRVEAHTQTIERIKKYCFKDALIAKDVATLKEYLLDLEDIDTSKMEEFSDMAQSHLEKAGEVLHECIEAAIKREEEKAELEKLRREAAEREKREEEERIKKEAEEKAKLEAEKKVEEERKRKEQAEREKKEAEAKAAQEKLKREQAEEQARKDKEEAKRIAEIQQKKAAEKAREEERKKIEAEREKERLEEKKRLANENHVSSIDVNIYTALCEIISDQDAETVFHAIKDGELPNVSIRY